MSKRKFTPELLQEAVSRSFCLTDVCRYVGAYPKGASWYLIKNRVAEYGIDISHFYGQKRCSKPRHIGGSKPKCAKRVLTTGHRDRQPADLLRRALIQSGVAHCCVKCGNNGNWQEEDLILHVDHINGDWSDCRLENMQFMCPNCHSQTPTFGSKRLKIVYKCPKCQGPCFKGSSCCEKCYVPSNKGHCVVSWPSNETLKRLVWEKTLDVIATEAQGSMSGLRKHLKRERIVQPPVGYWVRRAAGHTHEESLHKIPQPIRKRKDMGADKVAEVRRLLAEGVGCREIGRRVGICHTRVSDIKTGKTYKMVEPREIASQ